VAESCRSGKRRVSPLRAPLIVAHLGPRLRVTPDWQVRCTTASRVRLFAIMSTGYEAELSQSGKARSTAWRRPEAFAQHRSFAERPLNSGDPVAISRRSAPLRRASAQRSHTDTRSVGRPEAGERFISRAKPDSRSWSPQARLRAILGSGRRAVALTVPRAVVPILLERLIASFCQAFPRSRWRRRKQELVRPRAEGFDAGIRLGQFIAADMSRCG